MTRRAWDLLIGAYILLAVGFAVAMGVAYHDLQQTQAQEQRIAKLETQLATTDAQLQGEIVVLEKQVP
jgi:Tfp pilus assembly protein PilN